MISSAPTLPLTRSSFINFSNSTLSHFAMIAFVFSPSSRSSNSACTRAASERAASAARAVFAARALFCHSGSGGGGGGESCKKKKTRRHSDFPYEDYQK